LLNATIWSISSSVVPSPNHENVVESIRLGDTGDHAYACRFGGPGTRSTEVDGNTTWYCAWPIVPDGIGGRLGSSPDLAGPNCDSRYPSDSSR